MYRSAHLTPEEHQDLIKERLRLGYPPHSPPHPVPDAHYYLITCACYQHAPILQSPARRKDLLDLLFEHLLENEVNLFAWMVLPTHYHLLLQITDLHYLGVLLRRVHGSTARAWNQIDGLPRRKVWFRYADRAIRSERHFYASVNYIHFNPVKYGYTESPYDWDASSLGWYLEKEGKQWLRSTWVQYPVRNYGVGWDE